jgi:hypothetical protein
MAAHASIAARSSSDNLIAVTGSRRSIFFFGTTIVDFRGFLMPNGTTTFEANEAREQRVAFAEAR